MEKQFGIIRTIVGYLSMLLLVCFCLSISERALASAYYGTLYGDHSFQNKIKAVMKEAMDSKVVSTSEKVYYVSKAAGSDSNTGTKSKPFQTIQKGLNRLKKGDTLLIKGGTYMEELTLKADGTKAEYITVRNAPGEQVVIDGTGRKAPVLFTIEGGSYIQISGLVFQNAKGQDACGIAIKPGSNHILFTHNKIKNIAVENPSVQDHCANGILLFGDNAKKEISEILLYQNKIYNCQTGWAECISVTGNVQKINVIKNSIQNTGNIGIDFSGNYQYCKEESKDFPRYCVAAGNTVLECISESATSYGIYVDGGQHIVLENNKITGSSGGIEIGAEKKASKMRYATKDIMVRNNTIKNNVENGITVGGYKKQLGWVCDVIIKNNICINNGLDNVILTLSKCQNITVSDNKFYNSTGGAAVVYMEFNEKYTKKIRFKSNQYYNGNPASATSFYYRGKEYRTFGKWKAVSNDVKSKYLKSE